MTDYLWNKIRQFLQFQHLEINAFAFIWHNEEWVQRAWWSAGLFTALEKKVLNLYIFTILFDKHLRCTFPW